VQPDGFDLVVAMPCSGLLALLCLVPQKPSARSDVKYRVVPWSNDKRRHDLLPWLQELKEQDKLPWIKVHSSLNILTVDFIILNMIDFSDFYSNFVGLCCRSTNDGRRILKQKLMKTSSTARLMPLRGRSPATCRQRKALTLWKNMLGKHRFLVSVIFISFKLYFLNKFGVITLGFSVKRGSALFKCLSVFLSGKL